MSQKKTYIWRMTYYRNIGFILRNGLHCCNCGVQDKEYVSIGFKTLITNRGAWPVTKDPNGVLNDYIPFYFHYKMPMLYKIFKNEVQDYNGKQEEIIYLVTTTEKIAELQLPFVFTDRHAYVAYLNFYNQYTELEKLNWNIIKDETWFMQYTQLRKELKQAEFLIHQYLPVKGILGIVVHNDEIATFVKNEIAIAGMALQVIVKSDYFYK
jgi:hypothetical protein